MNSIPFDGTGGRIEHDGLRYVYKFAVQLDATRFWDASTGDGFAAKGSFFRTVRKAYRHFVSMLI